MKLFWLWSLFVGTISATFGVIVLMEKGMDRYYPETHSQQMAQAYMPGVIGINWGGRR